MAQQRNEEEPSRVQTLKDRVAIGVMVTVPVAMAVAVAVTFAFQGFDEALLEVFSNGMLYMPM